MSQQRKMWMGITGFVACLTVLGGYLVTGGGNSMVNAQSKDQFVSVVEGTDVDLAFKMGGSIDNMKVKEGDTVKAGQLIATLSDQELLAKKDQAEAAYQLALSKVGQAKQGVSVQSGSSEAQINQARAAVDAATAQYNANKNGARPEEIAALKSKLAATQNAKQIAETNVKRMQSLLQAGAIPQAKLEEAQVQYDKAATEYDATAEQLKIAQSGARKEQLDALKAQINQANAAYQQAIAGKGQVEIREYDVSSAEAGVAQAKGALEEVNAYLANTKLISPVNGVVKSVAVQKGELIAQGFTVVTVQVKDDKFVKFYVDEDKLGKLKVGDTAKLFIPSLNKEVTGKVQVVAPAADFAVKKATQELGDRDLRAFQVKVNVDDPDVLPGFTVEWRYKGAE